MSGYDTRRSREAVIVDCGRSAFGKRKGALAGWHPTDLLGLVLRTLVDRNDIDPARIDDVVGGCVTQSGEQGCNVTRNAWVAAGLPWYVPATSVDRQCGSSQQAAHFVAQGVIAGAYDIAIACGVESMTRAPMSSNARGAVGPFCPASSSRTPTTRSASSSGSRRCSPTSGASRARRWTRTRCSRTGAPRRTPTTASSRARSCPVPDQGRGDGRAHGRDAGDRRRHPARRLRSRALAGLQPAWESDDQPAPDITAGNSSQMTDGGRRRCSSRTRTSPSSTTCRSARASVTSRSPPKIRCSCSRRRCR